MQNGHINTENLKDRKTLF